MSEVEIIRIAATIIALVIAVVGHEIMHGYVAYRYGDDTARSEGRLSINPIKHIDPIGTVAVPLVLFVMDAPFLFGWAKPVPVNTVTVVRNGGYFAAVSVSLAGVAFNFSLAILASVLLGGFAQPSGWLEASAFFLLAQLVIINVVLGVFNLWPIPPLDGANAIRYMAMHFNLRGAVNLLQRIEPYGMVVLIIIIATPLNQIFFAPAIKMIQALLG